MERLAALDRRTLLAGSVVAGAAAIASSRYVFAQDSSPEASPDAETGTDDESTESRGDLGQEQIDRLTAQLESVQADLDAVSDQVDTTTIDPILTQVTDLISQTQTGFDAGETDTLRQTAFAALAGIESARALIKGQITYAGLPSEQVRTSKSLARLFEEIGSVKTSIADSESTVDTSFYTSTAESIYTSAYDLYSGSAWQQASQTGRGASGILSAAAILTVGEGMFSGGKRSHGSGPGGPGGSKHDDASGSSDTSDATPTAEGETDENTPVEVPAPDFGS